MRRVLFLFICLVAAELASAALNSDLGAPYFYEAPIAPAVVNEPIMITMHGNNFTDTTAVRLAGNETGGCSTTTEFAGIDTIPDGTVSNFVRWSETDNRKMWVVNLRVSRPMSKVYVCFTTDGKWWHNALNSAHANHFRVWPTLPYAVASPWVISKGLTTRFKLHGAFIPQSTKGVLVNQSSGCDGATPKHVIPGGEDGEVVDKTIAFTPRMATPEAFLCIAEYPYDSWTVIPIDTHKTMTHTGPGNYPNDEHLDSLGVRIWPTAQRHLKADILCSTLIAGAKVTCDIYMQNKTGLPFTPEKVQFMELTDGAGRDECPFPQLYSVGSEGNQLQFTWTPQYMGREGVIRLQYNGVPLDFLTNPRNDEYYEWSVVKNATYDVRQVQEIDPKHRDSTVSHFFVQPPFSHIDNYAYTNLVDFNYFSPKADWVYANGITDGVFDGRQNGTVDREMPAATLREGVTTGTMTYTLAVPGNSERCRCSAHYYYAATQTDFDTEVFVGRLNFVASNGGGDVFTKTFNLYSLARKVIVTGGVKADALDGDIFTMEQLMYEMQMLRSFENIRIELHVDATNAGKLYWVAPTVKCAVHTPRTDHREIAELKRIYNTFTITAGTPMASWKTASGLWNGDPCANVNWQGVICRHYHVVGLDLSGNSLMGQLPSLHPFQWLESVKLRNNRLNGNLVFNNSRLVTIDASHNEMVHVSFAAATSQCIRTIKMSHNVLSVFPTTVTALQRLKYLDLQRNKMRSTIPHFPASMNLEVLHAQDNYLVSGLPFLPYRRLRSLDFSMNQLNGSVPTEYGQMQNLLYFDASKNGLTGNIPVELGAIRTAPRLVLRLEDNYFSGALPRIPVRVLDVRNNFFRCPLPYVDEYPHEDPDHVVGLLNYLRCDEIELDGR